MSMTGFGRAERFHEDGTVKVEVRTVNHRYCDIVCRLPRFMYPLEERIRTVVQSYVERGRVEISVHVEGFGGEARKVSLDQTLFQGYLEALTEIETHVGETLDPAPFIAALIRVPDLFTVSEEETDTEVIWSVLEPTLKEAMEQLVAMRHAEGARLFQDISVRMDSLEQLIAEMEKMAPKVVEHYRERLAQRVKTWESEIPVDPQRVAMEVALFAERANIDEELTRLRSHLVQMRSMCRSEGAAGRKLDFMLQEMFREINTIASKVHDQTVVNLVVEAKAEVEKIREQVQNVQ